jgi:hypothetical protein
MSGDSCIGTGSISSVSRSEAVISASRISQFWSVNNSEGSAMALTWG